MDAGSVDWKDLIMTSKFASHLTKSGAYQTAADILCAPSATLQKRTRLPPQDVTNLLKELSSSLCSLPRYDTRTVAEILELQDPPPDPSDEADEEGGAEGEEEEQDGWKPRRITTGDAGLDLLLGDGIALGEVTEIAGQSASGKSNLCFQLSVTVQLPESAGGLRGSTLFISSEGDRPSSRLLSLAEQYLPRATTQQIPPTPESSLHPQPQPGEDLTAWDLLDNIHLIKADESEKLDLVLSYQVPGAIEQIAKAAREGRVLPRRPPPVEHAPLDEEGMEPSDPRKITTEWDLGRTRDRLPPLPVRLVVVDSIAAPFRGEAGPGNWLARSKELARAGEMLKRIAARYEVAVVVVNQVSDVFTQDGPPPSVPPPFPTPAPSSSLSVPPAKRARMSSPTHNIRGNTNHNGLLPRSSSPSAALGGSPSPSPPSSQAGPDGSSFRLNARQQTQHFSGQTRAYQATAALGPTWAQQVNTRLMLSRTERRRHRKDLSIPAGEGEGEDDADVVRMRRMEVVFSPRVPRARIDYVLQHQGLVSVGETQLRQRNGRYFAD